MGVSSWSRERVDGVFKVVGGGMGVDLGIGDAGVAQEDLDYAEVVVLEDAGGESVTQPVGVDGFSQGFDGKVFEDHFKSADG